MNKNYGNLVENISLSDVLKRADLDPIKALEEEVDNLENPFGSEGISEVDTKKIKTTQEQINEKLRETYKNLNSSLQNCSY